jgi:hypothetical protein
MLPDLELLLRGSSRKAWASMAGPDAGNVVDHGAVERAHARASIARSPLATPVAEPTVFETD